MKSLTSYVLVLYTLFQESVVRFQISHGWAWHGMVWDWKRAVKKHTKCENGQYKVEFHELLYYWADIVREWKIPQMCLIEK